MKRITRFTLDDLLARMDDGAYVVLDLNRYTLYIRDGEYLRDVSVALIHDAVKRNAIKGTTYGHTVVYNRVARPAVIKHYARR